MTGMLDPVGFAHVLDEVNQLIDAYEYERARSLLTGAELSVKGLDSLPQPLQAQYATVLSRLDGTCLPHTAMTNSY